MGYEGHVDAATSDRFERGLYDGDYRDLDLSGRELSYFDSAEIREQEDRLEQALADALAMELAGRVYSRTTSWIP